MVIYMRTGKINFPAISLIALAICGTNYSVNAADVDARLSSQEAWVGSPVILQLTIQDAADYEQPEIPEIPGCEIRAAGAPSQSSQITIINGRRTQKQSVVMQYLITPRREGSYEIPPFTLKVDGRSVTTQKLRFVATKSETGNLLFVEITGGKDKVYVGQPLELTLKIWIKPFHDAERNITLSEANMWQLVSEQTAWGGFLDRMKELAANNQRPGGREVLRVDETGTERSYYLYEITATVYPRKPGKVDADDVQVVVDYPTALGKARDPFAGFFEGSGFGRSPFSNRGDDDFFASPFRNQLTVSATRPVTGQVKVHMTEVLPVPTEGRPADYRGAVGRYSIVTQATPTAVSAGDSMTLNIGISGTGPMELLQAPPLSELQSLTADFKIADQSLAGFVQDNTKLFQTTIRPRREGVTQIPAIPFSFFDPDTGKYETALSEPITITVDTSDSLSLDSIVGKQRNNRQSQDETMSPGKSAEPEFTNDRSAAVLISQSASSPAMWWWYFVIAPPILWIITVLVRHRARIVRQLPSFRSAKSRCLAFIQSAQSSSDIVHALTRFIEDSTRQKCPKSSFALGALRTAGMTQVAIDVETFFQRCEASEFNGSMQKLLSEFQREACELVGQMEAAISSTSKSLVRRSKRTATNRAEKTQTVVSTAQRTVMICLAALSASSGSTAIAAGLDPLHSNVELSATQQQTILTEADDLYSRATEVARTDSADAVDLFAAAAQKYQLLIDSGVHNAMLYRNLGNACIQSHQLGRAIANYERATRLAPGDRQLAVNLKFANSFIKGDAPEEDVVTSDATYSASWLKFIVGRLRSFNSLFIGLTGMRTIIWTLVTSSLLFWGLQIARTIGFRFPVWRFAMIPLLLLLTSLTSTLLASTQPARSENGIIVAEKITLHASDAEESDALITIDAAQGHRVRILAQRANWLQIKTRQGHTGWLHRRDAELIQSVDL